MLRSRPKGCACASHALSAVYGKLCRIGNAPHWKCGSLIGIVRSSRTLSEFQDGVTGVAETRQFVALKFWVQLPGNSPTFPRPMVRAAPSHGEGSAFESLGKDQFDSDWRSW